MILSATVVMGNCETRRSVSKLAFRHCPKRHAARLPGDRRVGKFANEWLATTMGTLPAVGYQLDMVFPAEDNGR